MMQCVYIIKQNCPKTASKLVRHTVRERVATSLSSTSSLGQSHYSTEVDLTHTDGVLSHSALSVVYSPRCLHFSSHHLIQIQHFSSVSLPFSAQFAE